MNFGRLATFLAVAICSAWGIALAQRGQIDIDPVSPFEPPPRSDKRLFPLPGPLTAPGSPLDEHIPDIHRPSIPARQQQLFAMCVLASGAWTILQEIRTDAEFRWWQFLIGTRCNLYNSPRFPEGAVTIGAPPEPTLFRAPKVEEKGDDKPMDTK